MIEWRKFRRRPIISEAYQTDRDCEIQTLNGPVTASAGDWIIKDVNGVLYPCNSDVFEKTYEIVEPN